jgi:release factor glutamine methyltransferase
MAPQAPPGSAAGRKAGLTLVERVVPQPQKSVAGAHRSTHPGAMPGEAPPYIPTISSGEADRIRQWHERAYREGLTDAATDQHFDYLGLTVVVPPEVMPVSPMSHLLGDAVLREAREGERVLDMGTGSGVNALLAATKGARVAAVDINPKALEAARANAARNGLADRVEVRYSDVFSDVNGAFDLIIFDPPFRWLRPRSLLEAAMTDEGYRAITAFVREAHQHLRPGGRMLMFFGTSGDLGYLRAILSGSLFSAEVVATDSLTREGHQVEYFTFLVR